MSRENRTGVYEPAQTPELADLFKVYGRRLRLSIRTNTVGTVQTFDPATQSAAVRVDHLEVLKVLEPPPPPPGQPVADVNLTNVVTKQAPPIILPNVPVEIAGTSTDYVSFPVVPGTTGLLHVVDRGIRTWLEGLADQAVDPVQAATHALQDAVFVPGLRPNRDPITPPIDLAGTVLHSDTLIKLGRAAALGVARLTDQTSADATMAAWITAVTAQLVQLAAIFNVAPPGTPVVTLGAGGMAPPVAPSDFGVITTASTKAQSE